MLPLRPALRFSLFAAALLAANLVYAEVPASAPFSAGQQTAIQQLVASQVRAATPAMASAAAATVDAKTRNIETAKEVLEVGRNQVNYWLAFLGVLTAVIGLFGIVIPFFTVRNYKAEIDKQATELRTKLKQAEAALVVAQVAQKNTETAQQKAGAAQQRSEAALLKIDTAQQDIAEAQTKVAEAQHHAETLQQRVEATQQQAETAQKEAEQHAKEIEALLQLARDKTSLIPNAETFTGDLKVEVLEGLRKEKPPQVVALIEQAWSAHRRKDWKTGKPLWGLLSLIEGHDSNVWFNLGFTLAHMNSDWETVASCFERSHLLEPNPDALNNWGNALGNLAKNLSCKEEKEHGFAQACKKFAEATHIKPDYANAYNNWGCMLVHWGHVLSGQQREAKLQEAEEALLKAKELGDKNFYNLACLRAMQHRPDEARALLLETRNNGFSLDFATLSTDQDLDNLRDLDWFQQLLEEVRQQEAVLAAKPA